LLPLASLPCLALSCLLACFLETKRKASFPFSLFCPNDHRLFLLFRNYIAV